MDKQQTTNTMAFKTKNAAKTAKPTVAKKGGDFDVEEEPVIIDGEKWETAKGENDFPKFHDFKSNIVFKGIYVAPYEYKDDQQGIDIEAFEFKNDLGARVLLGKNYAISQAIEKYGVKKYRIEFLGQKALAGGKKVNEYSILHAEPVNV